VRVVAGNGNLMKVFFEINDPETFYRLKPSGE